MENLIEDIKHTGKKHHTAVKEAKLLMESLRCDKIEMDCCSNLCLDDFSKAQVKKIRFQLVEKSTKLKIEWIQSQIQNGMIHIEESSKIYWVVNEKLVCTIAFKKLYGITDYQIRTAKYLNKEDLEYPLHKGNGLIRHSQTYESVKSWLAKFFTSICDTYEQEEMEVPIYLNKNSIYFDMVEERQLNFSDFTLSQFYQMLQKDFKNVKFPKHTKLGRCDICIELQDKINLARTIDSTARRQYIEEKKIHTDLHKDERTIYIQ